MQEETIGDCRLILGDCRDVLPTLGKFDAVITDTPFGIGSLVTRRTMMTFDIVIAETAEQKQLANKIVMDYHSYVNTPRVVGRCIKYLIFHNDEAIATFWLGSGFKPTPKSILNYFKTGQKEFDAMFNQVADNKRFCIKSNPVANTGSQILKMIRLRAKQDWLQRYGDNLKAIITTIGNGKKGSVYLADNWLNIGQTAGLPKDKQSLSLKWDTAEKIAQRYVKPTGEDKKIILITDRV